MLKLGVCTYDSNVRGLELHRITLVMTSDKMETQKGHEKGREICVSRGDGFAGVYLSGTRIEF